MGRKSTPLTTLNNVGTSEIFYIILEKNREITLTELVEETGLSYASVREQLIRLKTAKIIKKTRKEGKYQNYIIDWESFVKLIIKYLQRDSKLIHASNCPIVAKENQIGSKNAKEILEKLGKDKDFVELIKNYFKGIAQLEAHPQTISELIESLEEEIISSERNYQYTAKEFGKLLKKWKETVDLHENPKRKVFYQAWQENREVITTKYSDKKIEILIDVIKKLEERIGLLLPIEDVLAKALEKGLDEQDVEKMIIKLKRSGDLYEPKRGFIKRI